MPATPLVAPFQGTLEPSWALDRLFPTATPLKRGNQWHDLRSGIDIVSLQKNRGPEGARFFLQTRVLLNAVHQLVDHWRQDQVGNTEAEADQDQHPVGVGLLRDGCANGRAMFTAGGSAGGDRCNDAGHVLGHGEGEEPAAHGHAGFLLGGQLGHHGKADW